MTKNITPLTTWEGFTRLSGAGFRERYPDAGIRQRRLHDPDEDEDEGDEDDEARGDDSGLPWLLVTGNVSIGKQMLEAAEGQAWSRIVVDGDLHIDDGGADLGWGDPLGQVGFVGGDLYVDAIRLDGMQSNAVRGRVVAKSAWLLAEDDCAMRRAPELRLDTQFLFAWFYRIDQLTFNPGAVIFMLGSGAYCAKLDLPNPVFAWHDAVHVLDGRFVAGVLCDGSDDYCWHSPSIIPALKRGRTIYRDGYDIACYPFHQAAQAAMAAGDHRNAYLLHKKSAAIAPAYYEAWFGMGYALLREGAWEQALGVYRKAATLFPKEQTGMINTALNHAALCALHTRQPGLAIELASMSIEHNQESEYKESEAGKAYRYRAEAYLMSGQVAAAMADLEQALELDRHLESARWLKGLAHYQRNELEQANADHAAACRYDKRYAVSYDTHGDTGFLYQADQRVDWDQIDAAGIALPARDEAYWLNYMLHDESASLGRVPDEYRSDALCREVVRASGPDKLGYAKHLPDSAFTREIAETLIASSPGWLENIPPRFIDKALVLLARPGTSGFALAQVPAAVIDFDVCVRAVQCGESIASVPPPYVNKALCLACVTADARRLDEVPPELIDDDLIAAAIAHGEHYGFDHWLPGMYKTRALLELAIGRYKCALDAIPGYRVDGAPGAGNAVVLSART
ncbi:tetratricopeptide repeat protein [Massilia sp. DJPM01]|uniref:tetratricopeptide repeat protein n=1 Tax=Massilia sp. DJPM01 TaxID=3024404 RepID=UPI00259D5EED|nr:tetratricopeptide repeat protein [Massilia sp. DJPM01]MDM5176990.1 tetratricopeptide repeat protein [Massilia sp. DJPM01]